ncbi:MAG: ribonuclease H family protein [Lachnospiraceae bacterium]|nr:ribonuclease H family protein [Lachnospiraceae bacterium]
MKQKYYAVRQGRVPGIYDSWDACREQVTGFPGAEYKSFALRSDAEAYYRGEDPAAPASRPAAPEPAAPPEPTPRPLPEDLPAPDASFVEIYVDGSFRADTGEYSYGMAVLQEGEELCFKAKFTDPENASMRNVAGEIRGAMAAMAYALENGFDILYLYHDYAGIRCWCTGEWKANKPGTMTYRDYYRGIERVLDVRFRKVKGHSHDHYNDLADRLAKEALDLA